MLQFAWICLGGAVGTGARYLIGQWAVRALGAGLPYGTFIVNVLGSFLISLIMGLSLEASAISTPVRLFLVTGVMGGLTTYSTFNYETLKLFQGGAWGLAAANVLLTVTACAAAGVLGLVVVSRLVALAR